MKNVFSLVHMSGPMCLAFIQTAIRAWTFWSQCKPCSESYDSIREWRQEKWHGMCGSICSNDNTQNKLKVYVLTYLLRVQQGW